MQKQQTPSKQGIETCTYTWNPFTGCLYNCRYCFAARYAKRFAGGGLNTDGTHRRRALKIHGYYELAEPEYKRTKAGKIIRGAALMQVRVDQMIEGR